MLKSTYKPFEGSPALPGSWSEHKAPTGHLYYYNSETKESTYTRPRNSQQLNAPATPGTGYLTYGNGRFDFANANLNGQSIRSLPDGPAGSGNSEKNLYRSGFSHRGAGESRGRGYENQRKSPKDRPKSKRAIPGSAPWLLVLTRLGRRFVYNPETGDSFWHFPPDVLKAVVELDRLNRETQEKAGREEASDNEDETVNAAEEVAAIALGPSVENRPVTQIAQDRGPDEESDEYEEVEVTDDEDNEENPLKRQKVEDAEQAVEFNEDDIAYQLATMGQDYGLDPGEYGDGQDEQWEEGAEGLPLSEEDSAALFKDMLDDFQVNPYTIFEKVIEEGRIVEDDRYTVLSSMRARKDIWTEWSKEKMQRTREQREKEERRDPRIPYLAFLQVNATPKLYWPEFRRKFKRETVMRDAKLSDKEREKWYREYISRLKLPESTLKSDLSALLKSIPLQDLNRSMSSAALPSVILTDIRYTSLRPHVRDPLIDAYIFTLAPKPGSSEISQKEEADMARRKQELEHRETALAEREKRVQEDKRKQRYALQHSKSMLREGEEEIVQAMKVGKEGLRGHLGDLEQSKLSGPSA